MKNKHNSILAAVLAVALVCFIVAVPAQSVYAAGNDPLPEGTLDGEIGSGLPDDDTEIEVFEAEDEDTVSDDIVGDEDEDELDEIELDEDEDEDEDELDELDDEMAFGLMGTSGISLLTVFGSVPCGTAADIDDALALLVDPGDTLTIVLDDNIDLGNFTGTRFTIPAGMIVTLDLNGKTMVGMRSANAGTAMIGNYGTLTIIDSSDASTAPYGSGKLSMGSNHPGAGWGTGCYILENLSGTINIYSGNFETTSNADVPYILNCMTTYTTTENIVTNIYGGNFDSYAAVARQYTQREMPYKNIMNVYGGVLNGATQAFWIQQATGSLVELNISGGTIIGERYAAIRVTYNYLPAGASAGYSPVKVNLSGGTYVNSSVVDNSSNTIDIDTFGETGGGLSPAQVALIAPDVSITGGSYYNHSASGVNVSHAMPGIYASWYIFMDDNIDITDGIFSHNPSDYVKTDDMPITSRTRNSVSDHYRVSTARVIAGLGDNAISGDVIRLISGTLEISAQTAPVINSGVEFVVESGTTMNIKSAKTGAGTINNGTLTNNGTLDISGLLVNNSVIQNNYEFKCASGEIRGTDGAWIHHGPNATDLSPLAQTVFFVDVPLSGMQAEASTSVRNRSYEYLATNQWLIYRLVVVDGSGGGDYASGAVVNISAGAAPAGMVFSHWSASVGGSFGNAGAANTTFQMPKSGVQLTANYKVPGPPTPSNVTVTFDYNDGRGIYRNVSVTSGSALGAAMPMAPTSTGYGFLGWYTSPTGGTRFTDSIAVSGNITVYARWSADYFTLSFDLNGSEGTPPTAQSLNSGGLARPVSDPVREGYTFSGWNTARDGGGTAWDFTATRMPANDVTLYAQWTPVGGGNTGGNGGGDDGDDGGNGGGGGNDNGDTNGNDDGTVSIFGNAIPLQGDGNGSHWALLNLILTGGGVLAAAGALISYFTGKKKEKKKKDEEEQKIDRHLGLKLVACGIAVLSVVVFLLTEDMRLPMAITDKWTVWMGVMLGGELLSMLFSRHSKKKYNLK